MKDFLGRELKVGDEVVFMFKPYAKAVARFERAFIAKFCDKTIVLDKPGRYSFSKKFTFRRPDEVIKI